MKTSIFAIAMLSVAGVAYAEVPAGPDAINGAFVRMMEHDQPEAAPLGTFRAKASHVDFERWVNAAVQYEMSGPEAGFARLLASADQRPAPLPVRGERDPFEMLVSDALQVQQARSHRYASL